MYRTLVMWHLAGELFSLLLVIQAAREELALMRCDDHLLSSL